jgi:hypothetical protein
MFDTQEEEERNDGLLPSKPNVMAMKRGVAESRSGG